MKNVLLVVLGGVAGAGIVAGLMRLGVGRKILGFGA